MKQSRWRSKVAWAAMKEDELMEKDKNSIEYLLSRYLLKKLFKQGLIIQEEFSRIDVENRKTFAK